MSNSTWLTRQNQGKRNVIKFNILHAQSGCFGNWYEVSFKFLNEEDEAFLLWSSDGIEI